MSASNRTDASVLFNPSFVRDTPIGASDSEPEDYSQNHNLSSISEVRDCASGKISSGMLQARQLLSRPPPSGENISSSDDETSSESASESSSRSGSSRSGSSSSSDETKSTIQNKSNGKISPAFKEFWREKRRKEKAETEGVDYVPKPKSKYPAIEDIDKLPPEVVMEAKSDMLLEMARWSSKKKICPSQRLSMESVYATVKIEYERMKKQKAIMDGSQFLFFITKSLVHGMETLNSSMDLFGIAEEAEGFTEETFEGERRGDVQECLEDICIEYNVRSPSDPLIRLALIIFGGWGIHIADAKYRKKMGMDRRLRGEDNLFSGILKPGAQQDSDNDEENEDSMLGGLKSMARASAQKNMHSIPSSGLPSVNTERKAMFANRRQMPNTQSQAIPIVQPQNIPRFPPPQGVDDLLAEFRRQNDSKIKPPNITTPTSSQVSDISYQSSLEGGSTTSKTRKKRALSKNIVNNNGMEF